MKTAIVKIRFFFWPILFLLLSLGPAFATATAEEPKREIAAKVNGTPIYLDQLEGQIKAETKKYERMMGKNIPENVENIAQRKALVSFIDSELIYQQARKLDIDDLEKQVGERVKTLKEKYPVFFQDRTEQEIQDWARREIFTSTYLEQPEMQPIISDDELRALYDKQKDSFQRKETVHVRHIIVLTPEDADETAQKQAMEKIKEARQKIIDGQPFADVAKEYSEDNAAQGGGDIGFVRKGYMPGEFEKIAFSLEPGKLSDIIHTSHGLHILEVVEKSPAGQLSFESMRDFLTQYLEEQKRKKILDDLVARLRKQADIQVLMK